MDKVTKEYIGSNFYCAVGPSTLSYLKCGATIYRKIAEEKVDSEEKPITAVWQLGINDWYSGGTQFYCYGTEENIKSAFPGAIKVKNKHHLLEHSKKDIKSMLELGCEYKWLVGFKKRG